MHNTLKSAFIGMFLATAAIGLPRPASALAVYCANCSTIATQLVQDAREAQSYLTQIQQYQTELQQYANMLRNTVALPENVWNTVQSDIMQVRSLSNAASLLTGNSGSILNRLQSAQGYASRLSSLGDMTGQFTTWQQTIGNNVSTLGQTLGLQQSQQQSDAALVERLQVQSQSAQGQLQAIQAGNELASANATQLMQIQATLSSSAQMVASNAATDADRRATEDAARLHFAQPAEISVAGREW